MRRQAWVLEVKLRTEKRFKIYKNVCAYVSKNAKVRDILAREMCNTRSTKNENVAHISLKNVFGRQPSFLWAIYAILRKKDSVLQIYRFRYKAGETFFIFYWNLVSKIRIKARG